MSDVFENMLYWKYHLEFGKEVVLMDRGRKLLVHCFIADRTTKDCEPRFYGYMIEDEKPDGTLVLRSMFRMWKDPDEWQFSVEDEAITLGIYNEVIELAGRLNA